MSRGVGRVPSSRRGFIPSTSRSTALLATESLAAKRTFAKKKGKTQMWITIVVVVGTVMLALLCALYCQCGDRIYTAGNNNRRNEQEPLIVEGKPIPPP